MSTTPNPRVPGTSGMWDYTPHNILWTGASGVNYSPYAQGQNIPDERLINMLKKYYEQEQMSQRYIDKVLTRLRKDLK